MYLRLRVVRISHGESIEIASLCPAIPTIAGESPQFATVVRRSAYGGGGKCIFKKCGKQRYDIRIQTTNGLYSFII